MTPIIPRPTRKQQLQHERRSLVFSRNPFDSELYWQIDGALVYAKGHEIAQWFWERDRPQCEHDLRVCPICHVEKPYDPRLDYEAPAVQ